MAASRLVDRKIGGPVWEKKWIRVTDEVRGEVFAYSIKDNGAAIDGRPWTSDR
jgi:hypothetical protein